MGLIYIFSSLVIPLLCTLNVRALDKTFQNVEARNALVCLVQISWSIRSRLLGPIIIAYGSMILQSYCSTEFTAKVTNTDQLDTHAITILIGYQIVNALAGTLRYYGISQLKQAVHTECSTRAFKVQLQMPKSEFESTGAAKQKVALNENGKLDVIAAAVMLELPHEIFQHFILLRSSNFGSTIQHAKTMSLVALSVIGLLDRQVHSYQTEFFALHATKEAIIQDGLHNQQLLATWDASLSQVRKLRSCEADTSRLRTRYHIAYYGVRYIQSANSNIDILIALLLSRHRIGKRDLVQALYRVANFGGGAPRFQQTWKKIRTSLDQMNQDGLLVRSQTATDQLPGNEDTAFEGSGPLVELSNVSFQAGVSRREVVKDASVYFKGGQLNFLVGASGAGKSTILDTIQGVSKPTTGSVMIDNFDLNQLSNRSIIAARSFQMPSILDLSIRENVRLARPSATDAEVQSCCRIAMLDECTQDLPEGYATMVSRETSLLSSGQKQLLDIARSLSGRSIVLLDEPTANLDAVKARSLMANLRKSFKEQTVLIVTHDYSLIEQGDHVLTLKDGHISTHQHLENAITTTGVEHSCNDSGGTNRYAHSVTLKL